MTNDSITQSRISHLTESEIDSVSGGPFLHLYY